MVRKKKAAEVDWAHVEALMRDSIRGRLSGVSDECQRAFDTDRARYKELSERVRKEEQEAYRRTFRGE